MSQTDLMNKNPRDAKEGTFIALKGLSYNQIHGDCTMSPKYTVTE